MADPGFWREGVPKWRGLGGHQHKILANVPKKLMKMKEIGVLVGGGCMPLICGTVEH